MLGSGLSSTDWANRLPARASCSSIHSNKGVPAVVDRQIVRLATPLLVALQDVALGIHLLIPSQQEDLFGVVEVHPLDGSLVLVLVLVLEYVSFSKGPVGFLLEYSSTAGGSTSAARGPETVTVVVDVGTGAAAQE